MQIKKWKRFSELTGKCYENMIGVEEDGSCWQQAFDLLKEIIYEERQSDPNFASQLEQFDDATDYVFNIQGWLEDCIDEMDMGGEYAVLLGMCDDLLEMFDWPGYTGSDIKLRKSAALLALDRKDEAVDYCKKWMQKESDNIVAAVAAVYAFTAVKDFDAAEESVGRFISASTTCSDENDIMFIAASELYEAMGKEKEKERMDRALEEYDACLEKEFDCMDSDDGYLDLFDDALPFD